MSTIPIAFFRDWNQNHNLYSKLNIYVKSLGWYPSDIVEDKFNEIPTGHIIVEHGLDNTAVISFLREGKRYATLTNSEYKRLIGYSYNNLIDIHIIVDESELYAIHNRARRNASEVFRGDLIEAPEKLKSDYLADILRDKKIIPNLPNVDDAFIALIRLWKKEIHALSPTRIQNKWIAELINCIILIRAIEDTRIRDGRPLRENLIQYFLGTTNENISLSELLKTYLERIEEYNEALHVIDFSHIDQLNEILSLIFGANLIADFYSTKFSPYNFDFCIMSKHALSRIYENYTSVLHYNDNDDVSAQLSFLPELGEARINKQLGSYYTPQFIPRLFMRLLEREVSDIEISNLSFLEPAVGSGIFLRTFLEKKLNNAITFTPEEINNLFRQCIGIDIDPNAISAAKLSIALLYLTVVGKLPASSPIELIQQDFLIATDIRQTDVILTNPPFLANKDQDDNTKLSIKQYLEERGVYKGKPDLYLCFIVGAIHALKENGFLMAVLPNTFLKTESAQLVRSLIQSTCYIKCLIDISDHDLFPNASVYPILLVLKKRPLVQTELMEQDRCQIAIVKTGMGKAFSDLLDRRTIESSAYSIYEVEQEYFNSKEWNLVTPTHYFIQNKLKAYPKLNDFLDIRTGFGAGSKDIFMRPYSSIPRNERTIYKPYLEDRNISKYFIKDMPPLYFFYPFVNGGKLSFDQLTQNYPNTLAHLLQHEAILNQRSEVSNERIEWWEPNRPRHPKFMLVPKIVTPHLIFSPRFALDEQGDYAIARSPFLVMKQNDNSELLYFFVAYLNSTFAFRYLVNTTSSVRGGYIVLEPNSFVDMPTPDIISNSNLVLEVISLVKELKQASSLKEEGKISLELDRLITTLI